MLMDVENVFGSIDLVHVPLSLTFYSCLCVATLLVMCLEILSFPKDFGLSNATKRLRGLMFRLILR